MNRYLWLALGAFAIGTEGLMIAGVLPIVAADLRVPVALAGYLVTVFALTYAIGSPIIAILTAGWERKRLLAVALGAFAAGNFAAAFATSYFALICARAFLAIAASAYMPAAAAYAAATAEPSRRGRALSIIYGGMTVATVIGVPLGTLLAQHGGWRLTFGGVGTFSAIAAVMTAVGLPRVPGNVAAGLIERLAVARRSDVLQALAVTVFALAGAFAVNTYVGAFLQDQLSFAPNGVATVLFAIGIASAVGNFIGGIVSDRWGPRRSLALLLPGVTVSFLIFAAAGAFMSGATREVTVIVSLMIWAVFAWAFPAAQQMRLVGFDQRVAPISLSLNSSAVYLGSALGATLGSVAIHFFSLKAIGWVGTLCELFALLVFFGSVAENREDAAPKLVVSAID